MFYLFKKLTNYRNIYFKLIQSDEVPNIYSYTFRAGRELPSFHESTISLHSEAGQQRFLDSIQEEMAQVHSGDNANHSSDEWQDTVDTVEVDELSLSDDVFEHETTGSFCSTTTTASFAIQQLQQSPRRRTSRAPSIG